MIPPKAMVDEMLMGAGSSTVHAALTLAGYTISRSSLDTRISQLMATGDRPARIGGGACPRIISDVTDGHRGSLKLLERHLTTGMHWIIDPAKFEAACEQVRQAA